MPLILASNSASGGYNVANSLRFNSGSTDYLSKNSWATATSDKIFTYSTWVKRSQLANTERLFGAYAGSPQVYSCDLSFTSNNGYIEFTFGGASAYDIVTNAMFRDVSAWYHVVLSVDTTQATASNRIIIYVNGTVQTLQTANYPPQNTTYQVFRNNNANLIGSAWNGGSYYTGYMSETYFIDGQQLTPSSFGQTDPSVPSSGIWQPKAYTGSYGTNGFYLKFGNSAALGTDSSGNGNNFTVNNLTSVDQSTDTCTNNFATFNSIKFTGGDLTQGNLQLDSATASWKTRNSTIGVSTGKWFMEFKMGTVTTDQGGVAIVSDLTPDGNFPASDATRSPGIAYNSEGKKWVNGTGTASYFATMTSNDVIGIALDMDNGTVQFYRNGSTTGSPINLSDAFTSANYPLFFAGALYNPRDMQANFGSPMYAGGSFTDAAGFGNFSYAVPSGYYSLCTKNLANFG
jgi:hypothetical protein